MLMVVHKDTGVDSFGALLAQVKASPGKLNWGVASSLGFDHLAAERIMSQTGIRIHIIGYQGGAPMRTDLIANRVQSSLGAPGGFAAQIATGVLRPLVVTSANRWPDVPNVPTLVELWFKDIVVEPWFGAFGPAGVPANAVTVLNREISAAVQTPELVALMATIGYLPMPMTPAQITELANSSEQSWGRVIKALGIKPQ